MTLTRILQWIVVGNSALLMVQTVRVISVYSAIFSLTRGKKRQLPLHVWMIATSYLIYSTVTGYLLATTPEPNGFWRAIFFGTAGLIGQYALWNILSYDRRRLSVASTMEDMDD